MQSSQPLNKQTLRRAIQLLWKKGKKIRKKRYELGVSMIPSKSKGCQTIAPNKRNQMSMLNEEQQDFIYEQAKDKFTEI